MGALAFWLHRQQAQSADLAVDQFVADRIGVDQVGGDDLQSPARETWSTLRPGGSLDDVPQRADPSRGADRRASAWRRRSARPPVAPAGPVRPTAARPAGRFPPSTSRSRSESPVSSGSIGTSTRACTGPVSRPSSNCIRHTPGAVVAGQQCSLDRRRAAPSWQQREVQVHHRQRGERVRLDQLTEGDDDTEVGAELEHVVDPMQHRQAELERGRLDRAGQQLRCHDLGACRRG